MSKLRRFLIVGVMVLTALSMSAVVAPSASASASAGDLIKMDGLSSVYYLGDDGKRYVFPNEATYFSWYSDWSGVVTVPASELQTYAIGGNVVMRAGTKLVKITTDPSVYAVETNGTLRKISSEAQATALYGTSWSQRVIDVPDAFFFNYTIGAELADGELPVGTLVKNAGSSDIYYYDGTNYRMFESEAVFTANRFDMSNVITSTVTGSGSAITSAELVNTAQNNGGNVTPPVSDGSGLMVSLSSTTPAATTVPTGATAVAFTSFNVTASNDGDIVLQDLVAKKTGVGASSELVKVYIYEGDTRLSNGRSVSSSTNTATFSSLNITVPAGTTKTLSLVGDVSGTGEHFLGIESASAVSAGGATVSGSFPVTGNKISLSSTAVGQTDIDNSNSYTVKSGETQVEVGRLAVSVNSTEDGSVESLTLYNSGRDILKNVSLYRAATKVATATQSGDYFTFVLDTPYLIEKGESTTFTVKADIVGARNADTATLYVRYKTDVKIKGMTYGYYLAPTETGSVSAIDEIATTRQDQSVTVEAGQVTIASNGPVAGDVAQDSTDVVLMDFTIATVAAVDVEKVGVIITDSDTSDDDDVTNLEIVCDGSIVNEWADPVDDGAGTANTDTSVWSIPANTTKTCQVRADIESTKTAADTVSVTWDYSNWTFKDAVTGDSITDIIPSTDITGKSMTVTAASLTVSQANTPTAQTWVSGSSFDAMGFNFAAGDAVDTKITNLVLIAALDENSDATYGIAGSDNSINTKDVISSVEIYDGATKVGSTEVVSSTGTVTFDTLDWTVPASANKVLTVKVTTSTNAPYNSNNDLIKFYISSVTAEYGSGTSLTATISAIDTAAEATVLQTIATAGTLTAAADTNTPDSDLVLMGSTVDMTKVKFTSTNEAFNVEKLQVNNTAGTTDDQEYASVTITYPTLTGTNTKTSSFVGDVASFTGLDFYVAKDSDAILTISGTFNTETAGSTNDTTTALDLDYNAGFRSVAVSSGTVATTVGSADVTGNDMYLYESVPTIAFASDTPSGNLIPGANTLIAKIGITASAEKDITFHNGDSNILTLQLALARTDDATADDDSITLKDSDGNTLDTFTGVDFDATTEYAMDFSSNDLTVAAGTTEYISVFATTTDFEDDGDSIQVWLDDVAADATFGINADGTYARGNILFKGDIYGSSLVKP